MIHLTAEGAVARVFRLTCDPYILRTLQTDTTATIAAKALALPRYSRVCFDIERPDWKLADYQALLNGVSMLGGWVGRGLYNDPPLFGPLGAFASFFSNRQLTFSYTTYDPIANNGLSAAQAFIDAVHKQYDALIPRCEQVIGFQLQWATHNPPIPMPINDGILDCLDLFEGHTVQLILADEPGNPVDQYRVGIREVLKRSGWFGRTGWI